MNDWRTSYPCCEPGCRKLAVDTVVVHLKDGSMSHTFWCSKHLAELYLMAEDAGVRVDDHHEEGT